MSASRKSSLVIRGGPRRGFVQVLRLGGKTARCSDGRIPQAFLPHLRSSVDQIRNRRSNLNQTALLQPLVNWPVCPEEWHCRSSRTVLFHPTIATRSCSVSTSTTRAVTVMTSIPRLMHEIAMAPQVEQLRQIVDLTRTEGVAGHGSNCAVAFSSPTPVSSSPSSSVLLP